MSYSFSREMLTQLKQCDLVKYFKSRFPDIPIHRSGEYYVARCPHPDHDDRNPSFRIHYDQSTGWYSWTCFSCHNGKKGEVMPSGKVNRGTDAVAFVIWLSDYIGSPHVLTFQEAVIMLLNFFHIPLPAEKKKAMQPHEIINRMLSSVFREKFPGSRSEAYMLQRGFTRDTLERFHVGTDGDRIAIPLTDHSGTVQGFNYRHINGEEPKYIHSSARDGFIKSQYLFGLEQLDASQPCAYLTEGCMDVMMASQYRLRNVLACLGTAPQDSHAELLMKHHIQKVFLVFDGDEKGAAATKKAIDILRRHDIRCGIVSLPDGEDLCDFFRQRKENGITDLQQYTMPDYEYLLHDFASIYKEQKHRAQQRYLPEILEQASVFTSQEEYNLFLQYVYNEFDLRLEKRYVREAQKDMENSLPAQTAA